MRKFQFNQKQLSVEITNDQLTSYKSMGHPIGMIEGINKTDLCVLLEDFLEDKICNKEPIYDQNGGEINSIIKIDNDNYQMSYTLYGIQFDEDSNPIDIDFKINGFFTDVRTFYIKELEVNL